MRNRIVIILLVGLALSVATFAAAAQSLGDLARQQRQQRAKEAKKPSKVITNESLPPRPASEGPTAASGISEESTTPSDEGKDASEATSAEPQSEASSESTATEETKPEDKMKSQEYWQSAFKAAKAKVAAAEEVQRLVEDELGLLQIQRTTELSPTVQDELDGRINSKTADAGAKRADTTKAKQALEKLEKDFAESGAPADWSKTE